MIGSIIGDISGSTYEFEGNKDPAVDLFPPGFTFTDDTILLVATADAILNGGCYGEVYQRYGQRFPRPMGGYGANFGEWIWQENPQPYGSWGNGAAMGVAPIGWAFDSLENTLDEARKSAIVSHDHPEGVKGAQATVAAIWLARNGRSKGEIRKYVTECFGYDLSRTIPEIRSQYWFNESCQGTVPEALTAFLYSGEFEGSIRSAISLGGDADTLACITGGISEAFYPEIPCNLISRAEETLPTELLHVVHEFQKRFGPHWKEMRYSTDGDATAIS